ncbi:hypothetical protein [Niallia taxi]|uniref:hypothetical protein n=1 Tax=Niallia taxi TaxID=2499688 RepID=UPI002E2498AE|nr:hypothetical protein [Niallia taxi]
MNLNSFSKSDQNQSSLSTMTFTFNYKGDIGLDNGFKLHIKKGEVDTFCYYFIVTPVGIVSPRSKAKEIYFTLLNLADILQINWEDIEIILDLLEIKGVEQKHLYKWIFSGNNEDISDEIIELNEISMDLNNVFSKYYNEMFSTFTNSTLNNKQKVELSAYALAETCYDEFSAENISKNFKMALKNAVKRRKTLKTTLSKLL